MKRTEIISNLHATLALQKLGYFVNPENITPVALFHYNGKKRQRTRQLLCWKARTENNSFVYLKMDAPEIFPRWNLQNKNLEETPITLGRVCRLHMSGSHVFVYLTDDEDMVRFERISCPAAEASVLKEFWYE